MNAQELLSSWATPENLGKIGLIALGGLGTLAGVCIRHFLSKRNVQFQNLHTQKMSLYPQVLNMIDKTIGSLSLTISKRSEMTKEDLNRIYEILKDVDFLKNVQLIADTKLAKTVSTFHFKAGMLFGKIGIYLHFTQNKFEEGLRYEPLEMELEELKVMRKTIFNLIRKEMGSGAVSR